MIVFVLRHADRTDADELSAAGKLRAELLARMLAETGITAAFHSDAKRTAQTLAPLQAKVPGLQVKEIGFPPATNPNDYGQRIATALRALPAGAVAAVVGHTNTVGATISALGGGPIDPIKETEFDKLFELFIEPNGTATLLKMRYGAPT